MDKPLCPLECDFFAHEDEDDVLRMIVKTDEFDTVQEYLETNHAITAIVALDQMFDGRPPFGNPQKMAVFEVRQRQKAKGTFDIAVTLQRSDGSEMTMH